MSTLVRTIEIPKRRRAVHTVFPERSRWLTGRLAHYARLVFKGPELGLTFDHVLSVGLKHTDIKGRRVFRQGMSINGMKKRVDNPALQDVAIKLLNPHNRRSQEPQALGILIYKLDGDLGYMLAYRFSDDPRTMVVRYFDNVDKEICQHPDNAAYASVRRGLGL